MSQTNDKDQQHAEEPVEKEQSATQENDCEKDRADEGGASQNKRYRDFPLKDGSALAGDNLIDPD